jgi:uncharacterized protein YuzE
MEVTYSPDVDILYLRLTAEELGPGSVQCESFETDKFQIIIDVDGNDRIVGFEILDASKTLPLKDLLPGARILQGPKRLIGHAHIERNSVQKA